jgi:hypothetical protein
MPGLFFQSQLAHLTDDYHLILGLSARGAIWLSGQQNDARYSPSRNRGDFADFLTDKLLFT